MDFSEAAIRKNCPHCDPNSFALKFPLMKTPNFWVVCDVHPLTKGHILIMPKKHLSCIGEYPKDIMNKFLKLYKLFSDFIEKEYGAISSFEHGKIGQTVFHSHVQMFPYSGSEKTIIPEGRSLLTAINDLNELKEAYQKDGSYLFFSIGKYKWIVDVKIGKPRFFRDRFAKALHNPDRGNWKEMRNNPVIMEQANKEIHDLMANWKKHQINSCRNKI